MYILVHDPERRVGASDAGAYRVTRRGKYAMVRTPRYAAFRDRILEVTGAGVDVCEVSGQDRTQVKVKMPKGEMPFLQGIAATDILDTIFIHGQNGAYAYDGWMHPSPHEKPCSPGCTPVRGRK